MTVHPSNGRSHGRCSTQAPVRSPLAPRLWIGWAVLSSAAGWILSAFHQLNRIGYGLAGLLVVVAMGAWWMQRSPSPRQNMYCAVRLTQRKLVRRFRRLLPGLFLLLTILVLIGAVLHPPANGDALSQRIPRVLHWLADSRWHWIDAVTEMLNTYTCAWEWMAAPIILFTKTDRWLFVINLTGFLLLPGLVFSVFHRLGVRPRVAWYWMWLLPSGYGYLLQAGGVYNDAMGAVAALAAIDFALRARVSRRVTEAWFSLLAMAILSATKPTNLALGLPWLIAFWPSWRLLAARKWVSTVCLVVALLVSFVPTAFFNHWYTGDWTGYKPSHPNIQPGPPAANLLCNVVILARENLFPPVFPLASWWNREIPPRVPNWLHNALSKGWNYGRDEFRVREMTIEEVAGLGFGVSWLLLISMVAGCVLWRPSRSASATSLGLRRRLLLSLAFFSPYVSLAAYMVVLPISTSARNVLPFYPLLFPAVLLVAGHGRLVRTTWWRWCATGVMLLALVPLVLNPHRPLWPAVRLTQRLMERHPTNATLQRIHMVYLTYQTRWDTFAPLRAWLPAEERTIGFMPMWTSAYCEASLWRPFGTRRVRAVHPYETRDQITAKGVRYVVMSLCPSTPKVSGLPFEEWFPAWLTQVNGRVIGRTNLLMLASAGPLPWAVVEVQGR